MKVKKRDVEQIEEEAETENEKIEFQNKGNFSYSVSTGSTLLDLAISGGKVHGGGIPGGILLEVFGPPSVGKTAILSEICASAQSRGGRVRFLDPEARLDAEYSRIYGVDLDKADYHRPDTVREVFDLIYGWKVDDAPEGACNVIITDSLAALSSEAELSDKGDKQAGRRIAKDFNEGLRKTCRRIRRNNWLIACSNQLREGEYGVKTPGGRGIPFYASLRINVRPTAKERYILRKIKFHDKAQEKVIGIRSVCEVQKSSIDDPYRDAEVDIIFNYGVDDIRANLQWRKTVLGATTYDAIDKEYQAINDAIRYIEEKELEQDLQDLTIQLWGELHERLVVRRRPKRRG
jgi:recombination protein RecA